MSGLARLGRGLVAFVAVALIGGIAVVFGAAAAGYRPVVIQTGSMGDTAPPGSLVVAAPRAADEIAVGDVLVMRREGKATVTHRVIEIERSGNAAFAITQGDANEAPDATPYPLVGEQLVGRWYLPQWGRRLEQAVQPHIALSLVGIALAAIVIGQLRRIWSPATDDLLDGESPAGGDGEAAPPPFDRSARRRRRMAAAALPLSAVLTVGVSFALFRANDTADANVFGTRACFDPQLGSVQKGQSIHAVDGAVVLPITPVDPTKAFVLASVRSDSNEPTDANVRVRLVSGGTEVELFRNTDAGSPPPVTVEWSVVEYTCGVTVQRGLESAPGSNQVDVTLPSTPVAQSFVVATSATTPTATSFGSDDLITVSLTSDTNLRIRTGGEPIDVNESVAWQVVTFDDPGDIAVQTITTTLGVGATDATIALPTPVDLRTTFLLSNSLTATVSGSDIGARLVRTHLASPSSVAVSRAVGGESLEVEIQVVTLRDGSTVRHGTVDLGAGQPARTVTFDPVDVARSTAISTVAVPGPSSGGRTTMVADDVVGEASATFTLLDETTLQLTRDATTSDASFGWQVIEWAGPSWWDPNWTFRQRIDVVTDTAAAPGGYTVPVEVDHAALVTNGLARPDGGDVRVLRWDGSTWTELDRILDDGSLWNTSTTTLLFRTVDPIDAADRVSYWLYFGNESPGSAPAADPEGVFALVEDFESGTLGDFEDRTAGGAWYQALPWTWRRSITVPAGRVVADVTDFRLPVRIDDPALGAAALADGSDIRFTAADGVTPLPHEIEDWDPAVGALRAWVRVPVVTTAAPTTMYVYAGAPDAPDQQDPRAVWSDVDGVWLLADDPAGAAPQADDAGPRNLDGATVGSMSPADSVTGPTGLGFAFDGFDDRLDIPALPLGASGSMTASLLLRPASLAADATVLALGSAPSPVFTLELVSSGPSSALPTATLSVDGADVVAAGPAVTTGTWQHLAVVWDGADLRVYVDGIAGAPVAAVGRADQTTQSLTVGATAAGASPFEGDIDVVRVDQRALSAAEVAASSAAAIDPAFATLGAVETGTWLGQGTWNHRKPVALDAAMTDAALTDQPVLISVVDTDLAGRARADGVDIVFTAADGVTRLDHVIETWDSGSGELTAWVRVPALSAAADTLLYVYSGNAGASDQQDGAAVFGPDADLALLPG